MSLVKRLTPKTEAAREFCAKYGDTFVIEFLGNDFLNIRSTKTQETLMCDILDGTPYINGEKVEWGNA